jgi:CubicO group peptidase (beta-lactamase class C family)
MRCHSTSIWSARRTPPLAGDMQSVQNLNGAKLSGLRAAGGSMRSPDGFPAGRLSQRGKARRTPSWASSNRDQRFGSTARAAAPAEASRDALAGFDALVNQALADFQVPGLALVIVRDGQMVMSRGFGYRDVARRLPVTTQTLFEIGSSTKAFTVMLLGQLVDEGRLDWDEPVRTWLPDFGLRDPMATEQMTPRDLVTHRSGLPRHDLVWYNSPADRPELFRRLRHLEPNKGLREEFQYNNLMFMTAGYLTERVTGQGWEEQVRARIFQPLGMTHSLFRVSDLARDPDACLGYQLKQGLITTIPYRDIVNVAPAGAIKSCADDMTKWLLAQLGGTGGGRSRAGRHAQGCTPRRWRSPRPRRSRSARLNYGLGWFIQLETSRCTMALDSFSALVTLFPD